MEKDKLCKNVLVNVNKIITQKCDEKRYIEFSKKLDQKLRCKYGKYYICDQVNQDRKDTNVFYVEAFYRDIPGICKKYSEINNFINDVYYYEFGDCIERIRITGFMETNKVYPTFDDCTCKDECDCRCKGYCEHQKFEEPMFENKPCFYGKTLCKDKIDDAIEVDGDVFNDEQEDL